MPSRAVSVGEPLARPSLTTRVVGRTALSEREVDAMHDLLAQHFLGVDRQTFLRDLSEKNWVVLLEDDRGALRGFSTFLIYATTVDRRPTDCRLLRRHHRRAFCVGIAGAAARLDPRRLRRRSRLSGGRSLLAAADVRIPDVPVRVRVLPRFLPQVRRSDTARVPTASGCPEHRAFRPRVRCARGSGAVLEASGPSRASSGVPDGRSADPHVRFFLERNPGHIGATNWCRWRRSPARISRRRARAWRGEARDSTRTGRLKGL